MNEPTFSRIAGKRKAICRSRFGAMWMNMTLASTARSGVCLSRAGCPGKRVTKAFVLNQSDARELFMWDHSLIAALRNHLQH